VKKTAIAYWLIPAKPERELFRELIRILTKRFDAPRFEPHLTIFVTSQDRSSPRRVLRQTKASPIRLRVRGIGSTSKFTKTLFVRFVPNRSLKKLVVDLAGKAKSLRDPHVSFLYQKLPLPIRKELAATIKLPFREVAFDSIQAVRCVSPTTNRADVEAWRTIATKSLRR
jgi:hypothetical protein